MHSDQALHPGPSSAHIIADIFELHFPNVMTVLDLTWGKGGFWRWDWRKHGIKKLHANDLSIDGLPSAAAFHFQTPIAGATKLVDHDVRLVSTCYDFRAPYPTIDMFDVVLFDPPFSAMGPASKGGNSHSERYGAARHQNGGPQSIDDIWAWTVAGIKNATAIAVKGVVVKCQPVVEWGKYYRTHQLAAQQIEGCGFDIVDEVFFAPGRRPQPNNRVVRTFHSKPSIFLIAKPAKVNGQTRTTRNAHAGSQVAA